MHFRRLLALPCSYETHDCHRTDFHETSCIIILLIFVNTFRFDLKSDTLHERLLTITDSPRLFFITEACCSVCEVRVGFENSVCIRIGKV